MLVAPVSYAVLPCLTCKLNQTQNNSITYLKITELSSVNKKTV